MSQPTSPFEFDDELSQLCAALCDSELTAEQQTRLETLLGATTADGQQARQRFLQYMLLHGELHWSTARDVRSMSGTADHSFAAVPGGASEKSEVRSEGVGVQPLGCLPSKQAKAWTSTSFARSVREALWHPIALLLIVGFVSAGVLAYVFSTRPAEQTVNQPSSPAATAGSVAKVVGTTQPQWSRAFTPDGDSIRPGQRLVLQRGTVEMVFHKQARVIFEGPSDFVITDAAACRLNAGKLTAHVPDSARGFKVHTPEGTVTDLGTEFGVYVKTGAEVPESNDPQEQTEVTASLAGKESPTTEVHVFKGKVEVSRSEVGSRRSDAIAQNPTSDLRPPTLVAAGQAVTISDNKVEPLPAADPFQFALDKLQGKPRTVLLAEDFESYDVADRVQAIGPWIVQSGTRKGQGVSVSDVSVRLALHAADAHNPVPNLTPLPPVGHRAVVLAAAAENPKNTFPLLAHEIDGQKLTGKGLMLLEFDLFLNTSLGFEPSLAFGTEVGHSPGIELWHDAEGKRIEWPPYQCYRIRLLLDIVASAVRDVRVERSQWKGSQGWQRDATFQPLMPKIDWSTPPRYVIFGNPVVRSTTPAAHMWLDNICIEVIAEK